MSAGRWLVHLSAAITRASGGQFVWRDRRGRGGSDRWAHPSGHFSASREFGQARYQCNVDN
eukprot:7335115-Pyramimonas_sp.AAC.1